MATKKVAKTPGKSLVLLVEEARLDPTQSKSLLEQFQEYEQAVDDWKKKSDAFQITNVNQTTDMEACGLGYKFLKEKFDNIESTRKTIKAPYWNACQAIDGIANHFKALLEPLMEELKGKADFAKNKEKEDRLKLGEARMKQLEPYNVFIAITDVAMMQEDVFQAYLKIAKDNFEQAQHPVAEIIAPVTTPQVMSEPIKAPPIGTIIGRKPVDTPSTGTISVEQPPQVMFGDALKMRHFVGELTRLDLPEVLDGKAVAVMAEVEQNILDSVRLIETYLQSLKS